MTEDRQAPATGPTSAEPVRDEIPGLGEPLNELERVEKELGIEEADGSPGFIFFGAPVARQAAASAEPEKFGSSFLETMRKLVGR